MPITELIVNKVDRLDVVWVCGPQPDGRVVFAIKSAALLMAIGHLQTFLHQRRSIFLCLTY